MLNNLGIERRGRKRWRIVAGLLVVALVSLGLAGSVTAADNTVISGTVIDESTDKPIGGIYVYAEATTHNAGSAAFTKSDGTYVMTPIAPGNYVVGFVDFSDAYVEEYWKDTNLEAEATVVTVSGGDLTLDASMRPTGWVPPDPDPGDPGSGDPGSGDPGSGNPPPSGGGGGGGGGTPSPAPGSGSGSGGDGVGGVVTEPDPVLRIPSGLDPIERAVARLYIAVFNRLPDPGGLAYWSNMIRTNRLTLGGVVKYFIGANEFTRIYRGLDSSELLNRLYGNVLGRRPDPGGHQYWLNRLRNGLLLDRLVLFFSESPEFVARTNPRR